MVAAVIAEAVLAALSRTRGSGSGPSGNLALQRRRQQGGKRAPARVPCAKCEVRMSTRNQELTDGRCPGHWAACCDGKIQEAAGGLPV
jgi:hypothetical protein